MVRYPNAYRHACNTTNSERLLRLSRHPDAFVRARAIGNKHVPTAVLLELLAKEATPPHLRADALEKITLRSQGKQSPLLILTQDVEKLCMGVVERALQSHEEDLPIRVVAARYATQTLLLLQLMQASKQEWEVKLALVNNPNCGEFILKQFAAAPTELREPGNRDNNFEIREIAKKRLGATAPAENGNGVN